MAKKSMFSMDLSWKGFRKFTKGTKKNMTEAYGPGSGRSGRRSKKLR